MEMLLVEYEHLETPRSSSHICFWFGRSGITLTVSTLVVSQRCGPQYARILVELRCGATDEISSNGWTTS